MLSVDPWQDVVGHWALSRGISKKYAQHWGLKSAALNFFKIFFLVFKLNV